MDLITILLLTFGWIFNIKGLIIASLIVSVVFTFLLIIGIGVGINSGKTRKRAIKGFVEYFIVLTLSIIKLYI